MTAEPRPAPSVVDDPIAVDVINDPLRWRIYNQLYTAKTAQELGGILGVPPARLYYHLDLLERHGWVRVVEERPTGGRGTKRVYRASHEHGFVLSDPVMQAPGFNTDGWQIGQLQEDFAPFERNLDNAFERGYPPDGVFGGARVFRRVAPDRAAELCDKIEALFREYLGSTDDPGWKDGGGDAESPLHGFLFICRPFVEPPSHLQSTK